MSAFAYTDPAQRSSGRRPSRAHRAPLVAALLALLVLCGLFGAAVAAGAATPGFSAQALLVQHAARSAAPGKATARTPRGTFVTLTTKPTFAWRKAARATSYELNVYNGPKLLLKKSGLKKLSWMSSKGLPTNVSLTWKVRGRGAGGAGPWSKSVAFKIVSPFAPQGTITTTKPTFKWRKFPGDNRYELRVLQGAKLLFKQTGLKKLSRTSSTALPTYVTLTWKVRGSKQGGKARRVSAWKSFKFEIVPASAASQIAVNAGQSQSATAGAAVATAPSVIVKNASGNPISGTSVTFAVANGGGSATGLTAITSASGVATVGSWTLGATAGANSLTATSSGLTGSPVTFTATGSVGIATKLAITTQPVGAGAGALLATQPVVAVEDASGNLVSGSGATISVTSSGAIGGSQAAGLAAASGVSGFSNLTLAGLVATNYTLTFASSGLTSVTSANTTVGAGNVARFAVAVAGPQTNGVAFGGACTVTAQDAYGNTVTTFSALTNNVTLTASPSNGTITGLGAPSTSVLNGWLDFSSGVATLNGEMVFTGTAGSHTFTATSASGGFSGTSGSVAIAAGAATQGVLTTQPGGAANGVAFTTQPVVRLEDISGNAVSRPGASVVASVNSGSGTLGGTTTVATNAGGVAGFTNLAIAGTAGSYRLDFTPALLTKATSGAFTLAAGAVSASQSTVSASPPSVPADGSTASTVTVTLLDANGNPVSGKTVSLTQSSGTGSPTISAGPVISSGSGVVAFTVESNTAAQDLFQATDTTDAVTVAQTATVTFGATQIGVSDSKDGQAILTFDNMVPGDTRSSAVTIQNTGTGQGQFYLQAVAIAGSPDLADALTLVITDTATSTPVYNGPLSGLTKQDLGTWAANESHTYEFTVTFPNKDGAPASMGTTVGADNNLQGLSTAAAFTWTAVSV